MIGSVKLYRFVPDAYQGGKASAKAKHFIAPSTGVAWGAAAAYIVAHTLNPAVKELILDEEFRIVEVAINDGEVSQQQAIDLAFTH